MTGMVPDDMWLPSLVSLTLVDHELHGTIPTTVGKMLQLEHLALYDLFISSSIPSEIGNAKGNFMILDFTCSYTGVWCAKFPFFFC
jgi:hypothetical protein